MREDCWKKVKSRRGYITYKNKCLKSIKKKILRSDELKRLDIYMSKNLSNISVDGMRKFI